MRLEEAVLWYRVIDELAHKYLGPERPLFMDYFQDWLANRLALEGASPDLILRIFVNRTTEYGEYRKWIPSDNERSGGTLLWEAAKHIGGPFGESRNGTFLLYYGNLFLKRMKRALVYELLTGRNNCPEPS